MMAFATKVMSPVMSLNDQPLACPAERNKRASLNSLTQTAADDRGSNVIPPQKPSSGSTCGWPKCPMHATCLRALCIEPIDGGGRWRASVNRPCGSASEVTVACRVRLL